MTKKRRRIHQIEKYEPIADLVRFFTAPKKMET